MKLKEHIEVSYDKDSRAYVFDFSQAKKVGKVTSRMFPILIGKNGFNGIGYGVLDRCGFLDSEPFDTYYTVRGAIGEYFVHEYVKEMYGKRGVEIETKTFESMISYDGGKTFYGNDLFKKNERFGGVVDIAIAKPVEARAVIEVKSKSAKDIEKIVTNGNYPDEEVLQGMQLACLSKVDKLLMAYIFFSEIQEKNLKALMPTIENVNNFDIEELVKGLRWTAKDFDIHIKKFTVNLDEVQNDMDKAYENLHRNIKLGSIHELHFTNNEIAYLDNLIRQKTGQPIEEDTPF